MSKNVVTTTFIVNTIAIVADVLALCILFVWLFL